MLRRIQSGLAIIAFLTSFNTQAQTGQQDNSEQFSLAKCIQYAVNNQPALKQAYIDEAIAHTNNHIALSAWLPQAGINANFQHYLELPTSFLPNTQNPNGDRIAIKTGLYNSFVPQFNATQILFSGDVLLAARAAPLYIRASKQNTESVKIGMVANVSKAFYDVLLSQAQVRVLAEDTARLGKNLRDAYSQYVAGITDKVDYKRASIALNNSMAELKNQKETIGAKIANLKQLMGYPADRRIAIAYDTAQMMQEAYADTLEDLQYEGRIEYQQLQTSMQIQHVATSYYITGFAPSLSAFYNYVPQYQNNSFSDLLDKAYPYSMFGLTLSLPIFQGFKRVENIHKSKLQEQRQTWDMVNLKAGIYTEYREAMASYKGNLNIWKATQENVQMAREVYDVVKLQYREGIKQYIEVITAESDLRTSQINYLNALFHLLQSKVDLQRAKGNITTGNL